MSCLLYWLKLKGPGLLMPRPRSRSTKLTQQPASKARVFVIPGQRLETLGVIVDYQHAGRGALPIEISCS